MAFHSHRSRLPLCPSIVACNMATLLMADLPPFGGSEIWSGNQISLSVSSRIPIHLDEDGCSLEVQPFPQATHLLLKLAPLWELGIYNLSQILCHGPNGRPYFLEERELQWAKPSLHFPLLSESLTQALKYLRVILSSTDPAHWQSLCQRLTWPQGLDYSIAPRWRTILNPDWDSLPERPSPLVVDRATKQLSIERSLSQRDTTRAATRDSQHPRIMLNFPIEEKRGLRAEEHPPNVGGPPPLNPSEVAMPRGITLPSKKDWPEANRDASAMAADRLG